MPDKQDIKAQVQRFYDQVGWQVDDPQGHYQNAQYEDLRPVSADYIRAAHERVGAQLPPEGEYLLDAGSGPVQWPAYLAYSAGYKYRVCLDLSHVALLEARKRLGEHGLYVVADVAQLPFKREAFDGIVALHTIHHLPADEKPACYRGLYATLKPGGRMVTVDGWTEVGAGKAIDLVHRIALKLRKPVINREIPVPPVPMAASEVLGEDPYNGADPQKTNGPAGTHVVKTSAAWFKRTFDGQMPYRILPWRSVNVRWLREVIPNNRFGKLLLRLLSGLEQSFPRYFGENGQYPLIVFSKPS